jgi:hypothetical protein
MDRRGGSSGTAPALQALNSNLSSTKKKKKKERKQTNKQKNSKTNIRAIFSFEKQHHHC